MLYADVIVDITAKALDRPFQYLVPEELAGQVEEGAIVEAPFGTGNRKITGYVTGLSGHPKIEADRIKPLTAVVTRLSGEERRLTALAVWIRDRYGSSLAAAMRTVLPARKKTPALQKRVVVLAIPRESAERELDVMRRRHQAARERLMSAIIQEGRLPYEVCTEKLHVTSSVIQALVKKGFIRVERTRVYRNPELPEAFAHSQVELNEEQRGAVECIVSDWQEGPCGRYLIQGVTGSGKTEVYIELIAEAVRRGRQAIVLIPEIALTYQTMMRFYHRFGGRVSVIHSKMSAGERQDQFDRAAQGDLDVMVGPRSALFTPFPNLGIIVIDEEHEESYRSEQSPRYHAREVAFQRAKMEGAAVVLGSATPSMESYYRSEQGLYRRYELNERLTGGCLPSVDVTDLREELRNGNRSILSVRLKSLLDETLERGEQAMLFLNRRGFSGFMSCRSCGEVIKCPHCDVSLSLHRGGKLVCHYCGHEEPAPKMCPSCGSPYISGFRAGTEQIESFLQKEYPGARILRMDADSTARKGEYERILSAFANEEADILIGTQMIVKGHDFPKVTLVGILLADLSLYADDYRAAERTFQLLTQAAGRAGRGERPGHVVIQTYQPEHYSIRYAAKQDYQGFYREEIGCREVLSYPPAAHMLAVQILSLSEDDAMAAAGDLRGLIREEDGLSVIGPAAASYGRLRDLYRYAVYIKSENYDKLVACKDIMEEAASSWQEAGKRKSVQVQFDFDPVSAF